MSARRNTEHTKAYEQTQPSFIIEDCAPSISHGGLVAWSIRLQHVAGPLTEDHVEALYRAFVKRQHVYLVIPDAVPSKPPKPKRRRRR